MNATQKVALVTGATRGIGQETVRQLAEAGVTTLLAGRDPARTQAAADKLKAEGLPVEPITLDVTNADTIQKAVAEVKARFGQLDILVNNAGIVVDDFAKAPSEQTLDAWRETFDTNLFAVVEVTKAFLPLLKAAPAARIVNVSSQLGSLTLHVDPTSPIYDFKVPAYDASKSALNSWTVHLAYRTARHADQGQRRPSGLRTDGHERRPGRDRRADGCEEQRRHGVDRRRWPDR